MAVLRASTSRKVRSPPVSSEDLESLRDMLDAIPLPVFIKDTESRFLVLNQRTCEFMGVPHEQLVGRTDYDFVPKEQADLFRRIDRRVLQTGEVNENEEPLHRNGEVRTLLTRKKRAYLPDGSPVVVVCISDVTDLKQRESSWRLLFDQSPVPMWVYDRKSLQFLAVNQAAIDHYGYSREQFLSMTALDIRPKEDADAFREAAVRTEKAAYQSSGVWRHITADGRLIDVIPSSRAFEHEGSAAELAAIHDITELKRAEARIAHLATHDALTDLPNRSGFTERLESLLQQAMVTQSPFAVLSLDIKRFKDINDLFGHSAGDVLLKEVARRLSVAAEGAFIARTGGDEFALLVSDGEMPGAAVNTADRLLAAMAEETDIGGQRLHVELSIGIAFFPSDGSDAATLLANADAALYRAKEGGGGVFRAFEPEMDRRLRERRALKLDLREAISRNELYLTYQPQALVTGEIMGFEALLRWYNPERGQLSPAVFIPLAEESGLIDPIGEWALRQACREAASWTKPLQVAVNLSPVQFHDDNLPVIVGQVLQETGLAPGRLELEVTESVLFEDLARTASMLKRLKSLGVRVAMDDFGTGYSSLAYLQAFPFDKIKIDRSFISQLEKNANSAAIIRAVISLGVGLSMDITAEGVETNDQLTFLSKEGCHTLQGHLIGRPQRIEEYSDHVGRLKKPARRRGK